MSDFDIEKLLKQISELEAELKSAKKYGLVWDKEHTKEEVVLQCETMMPLLAEIKDKNVLSGNNNNLLIEGDNYHSLLSLNYVLKEGVDTIYIDPPYNTGNEDFTYNDKAVNKEDAYRHSKWLNQVEKRLSLARDLLKQGGLIFISIDDNEQANLKLLCDKVFGERNFVCNFIWEKTVNPNSTFTNIGIVHEYILCYSKGPRQLNKVAYTEEDIKSYTGRDKYIETRGPYKLVGLNKTGTLNDLRPNLTYPITAPDGSIIQPRPRWRWSKEKLEKGIKEDRVVFTNNSGKWSVYYKQYFLEDTEGNPVDRGSLFKSIISDCGRTTNGSNDLAEILGKGTFDFPKPVNLIKRIIQVSTDKNSVVLDFYAGSGTTGQAVLELNNEDGGNRRFILCTNNENTICERVTYPRLKTVITGKRPDGTKYSNGLPANLYYFKTIFMKDEANTEQAKYNLVEKIDALLCIAENIFDEKERNEYSSHFACGNKHLFIYNDYYNKQKFDEFKSRVLSVTGEKIVYIYSSDNNVDESLIEGNNIVLKPIPSKIYEIYKEVVEDIKRDE